MPHKRDCQFHGQNLTSFCTYCNRGPGRSSFTRKQQNVVSGSGVGYFDEDCRGRPLYDFNDKSATDQEEKGK